MLLQVYLITRNIIGEYYLPIQLEIANGLHHLISQHFQLLPEFQYYYHQSDNSTNQSLTPTLSWNAVTGADSYKVQVSEDAGFATLIINQSGVTETSFAVIELSNDTQYYWRVLSTNSAGDSNWSTPFNFTTLPTIAGVPLLVSPSDNATNESLNPTLSWNAVTGADSYKVQVSEDAGFATFIIDQSGVTVTTLNITGLSNNTQYYWRVLATNSAGDSNWSEVFNFTTLPTIAGVPVLTSPSDNSTNQSLTPTLSWNAVTGADSYKVQVSDDAGFATFIIDEVGVTETTLNVTGLSNDLQYYWRVLATNSAGDSNWSAQFNFTTLPTIAGAPVLVSPSNNSTNQSLTPTLSWNAVIGADSYKVQLSDDPGFATFIIDQSGVIETTLNVTGLSNETQYYWRVLSTNSAGDSEWSIPFNFTTLPNIAAVPVLVSPSNNSTNESLTPTLSWNAVSGTNSYKVQVSEDAGFATFIIDQSGVTVTTLNITGLSNDTQYYWRVLATNSAGDSEWSTPFNFTTLPTIAGVPVLISPSNNSTNQSLNPTLSWNAVNGADSYKVQLSDDAGFSNIVFEQLDITTSSVDITGLSNDTQYYWRVLATNSAGDSNWSAPFNFTTLPTIAGAPVLVSPTDNSTNQSLTPPLSWNAVTGADSYKVQLSDDPGFATFIIDQSGVTETTLNITELSNDSQYYWRVLSTNSAGDSNWSATFNFTTLPTIAAVPVLVSPSDNSTNQSLIPTLSWNAVPAADSYKIQLSDDAGFSTFIVNQSGLIGTSFAVTGLSDNTQYYWRVLATNSAGDSNWSTPFNFTTLPNIADAPVLASPSNNSTNQSLTPTLSWNAVTGADSYKVQVSDDAGFATFIIDEVGVTETTLNVTGLSNDLQYYWRVLATNSAGDSNWSAQFNFTTLPTIAGAPVLVSPSNNSTNQSLTPTLELECSYRR